MMTKKDYIRAAELIRETTEYDHEPLRAALTEVFIKFFKNDNPRFDSVRFRDAVYKEEGT